VTATILRVPSPPKPKTMMMTTTAVTPFGRMVRRSDRTKATKNAVPSLTEVFKNDTFMKQKMKELKEERKKKEELKKKKENEKVEARLQVLRSRAIECEELDRRKKRRTRKKKKTIRMY
jgi:intein/homing endonuclease